ncbi:ribosome modulation factor [Marinobacter sp. P4B1]|uniref:ribosome modulation factor n=1 Tax=Marinobacter sp. P4B1 TaxID=1119533 RepID=UPI001D0D74FF
MDAYVIDGPEIYRAGYLAGIQGRAVKESPHPVGDWRDQVWCDGWRSGRLDRLARFVGCEEGVG